MPETDPELPSTDWYGVVREQGSIVDSVILGVPPLGTKRCGIVLTPEEEEVETRLPSGPDKVRTSSGLPQLLE